ALYDNMPNHIYGQECSPAELAERLDTAKQGEIKRICKGNHHDWARECMRSTNVIHQWNPQGETRILRDDTIELSKGLIDNQLRLAGYRLAYLLNKYFDK
ncbi:MAG: hypothetical protein IJF63_07800, partial [Alistipes sp.]|nr:hypothetical protein [Alistipes sp.]